MKFSNADLIKLTEIKQYLLDPSYTFRLYQEASSLLEEAIAILRKYAFVEPGFYTRYEDLRQQMNDNRQDRNKLRNSIIQTGKLLAELTNR
ncbi:hypothetical protein [Foetidibacter luteolus]|uniref:hypothetical protein n=1 Tax=Foetidibacter luteolus TaxID=2608880 RepID=UPI00129A8744|nr:hypothetical protein [Foetidibacter luteolus]